MIQSELLQRDRLNWVDAAKGWGMILVVFGHVWRGLISPGVLVQDSFFVRVDSFVYAVHMPLFF